MTRNKPTLESQLKSVSTTNLAAARIILADPKSGGLQREWAEMIVAKAEQEHQ